VDELTLERFGPLPTRPQRIVVQDTPQAQAARRAILTATLADTPDEPEPLPNPDE